MGKYRSDEGGKDRETNMTSTIQEKRRICNHTLMVDTQKVVDKKQDKGDKSETAD